jgi:hypothetical protein
MHPTEILCKKMNRIGPLVPVVHARLSALPLYWVTTKAAVADRRPGRLVPVLAQKCA